MTITPSTDVDVRTDRHVDRCVDDRKDTQPTTNAESASAFVIVLANHKGGVTKTTSTANLGACLAEAGRAVLLVDCDPQANLSEAFGWTEDLPGERLEDFLARPPRRRSLRATTSPAGRCQPTAGMARPAADHPVYRQACRRRGRPARQRRRRLGDTAHRGPRPPTRSV
jgi:AAA domain-containing protein